MYETEAVFSQDCNFNGKRELRSVNFFNFFCVTYLLCNHDASRSFVIHNVTTINGAS